MMMRSLKKLWIGLAFAALAVAGCTGNGGGDDDDGGISASLTFVNASTDSPALDFLVDGDVEGNDLPYLGSTPGFRNVRSGERDISVRAQGSTFDDAAVAQALVPERDYAVLGVGRREFGSEFLKRLRLVIVETDRTRPIGSKARLIVVHAFLRGTGFETPNIDFRNAGANPQFQLNDIPYANSRTFLVDSGAQSFVARRTGTEQVYAERTEELGAGKVYLALVTGIEGGAADQVPQIRYIELATED